MKSERWSIDNAITAIAVMLHWIHVSVSRIPFVFPTLELHSLYDHSARLARGETLRSRAAHSLDSLAHNQSVYAVSLTGRAWSRNSSSDTQDCIDCKVHGAFIIKLYEI